MPPVDTPTQVVLLSFLILFGAALYLQQGRVSKPPRIAVFLAVSGAVWLVVTCLGEFVTDWATNNTVCYAYLGCNVDFFGFDAMEHFLFGFPVIFGILWIGQRFLALSVVSPRYGKTILTLVTYVTFIAVAWELAECAYDAFRITILHERLFDFRLHIDQLAQSSNFDTMGDISFTLVGAIFGLAAAEWVDRGILKRSDL